MVEANIVAVFIGIESPNEASLRETKKFQNVRAGRDASSRRSTASRTPGMEVWCGMIVGFDNDDADDLRRPAPSSSSEARIANAMIGHAHGDPQDAAARPAGARRAGSTSADAPEFGTNVIPLRIEPRGAARRLRRRHERPVRARGLLRPPRRAVSSTRSSTWAGARPLLAPAPLGLLKTQSLFFAQAIGLYLRLMHGLPDPALRREYHRRIWRVLRVRATRASSSIYVLKCAHALSRLLDGQGDGHRPRPDRQFVLGSPGCDR